MVAEIITPVCEGLIPAVITDNLRQRAVRCTASQKDIERASSDLGDSRRLCPRHQPIPSYGWCTNLLSYTKVSLQPDTVAALDLKPRKRNSEKVLKGMSHKPQDFILSSFTECCSVKSTIRVNTIVYKMVGIWLKAQSASLPPLLNSPPLNSPLATFPAVSDT